MLCPRAYEYAVRTSASARNFNAAPVSRRARPTIAENPFEDIVYGVVSVQLEY
jgi:hypothetical protein